MVKKLNNGNDVYLAALGIIGLLLIFVVSMWMLKRQGKPTIRDPNPRANRQLSEAEQAQLDKRITLQQERARRAQLEEQRLETIRAAKPVNKYQEKLEKREQERVDQEQREAAERVARSEKETAEYMKWKSQMGTVKTGSVDDMHESFTVKEFVEFIKNRKMLDLDEIANKFHLQVSEVVNRISSLEKQHAIYGIIDDRSKYCEIQPHEIDAIDNKLRNVDHRISVDEIHSIVNSAIKIN